MRTRSARALWIAGCALLMLLAPIALYYGWCWGWWGRGNMWLQYVLQCNCPPASESARYAGQFEVLLSACQAPVILVSPGGRFMRVDSKRNDGDREGRYLVDLQTMSVLASPTHLGYSFLTDNLLLVDYSQPDAYLLYLNSLETSPVIQLYPHQVPGGQQPDGTADPMALLPLLQSANKVFVLADTVVVVNGRLAPDSAPANYWFSEMNWYQSQGLIGVALRQYLDEHHVVYYLSMQPSSFELPSHSGAFVARLDGIYLVATGQRIIENHQLARQYGYLVPAGWVYDDRGVIMHPGGAYLIDIRSPIEIRLGIVYQPVLLLKVPAIYQP